MRDDVWFELDARRLLRAALAVIAVALCLAPAMVSSQVRVEESASLDVPVFRSDAAALAMGNAYVADGRGFNAHLYNPALSSRAPHAFELFSLGVTAGEESIEGARFLESNQRRFSGLDGEFRSAVDALGIGDVRPMNELAAFVDEFLTLFRDPVGGRIEPAVTARAAGFTFGVYGAVQAATQEETRPGSVDLLRELSSIELPIDDAEADRLVALAEAVARGEAEVSTVVGLGVVDVVASVGYARSLIPGLLVGVTGKIVNRRVGLRIIDASTFDQALQRSLSDISQSATRFGLDVGVLYELPGRRLSVGVSARDLVASEANVNDNAQGFVLESQDEVDRELAENGFTRFLVEDSSPTVVTAGVSLTLSRHLRANLDVADIAHQLDSLEGAADRLRVGAELAATSWLSLRAGLASGRPTAGVGVGFGPLELAYAMYEDELLERRAHRLQMRLVH